MKRGLWIAVAILLAVILVCAFIFIRSINAPSCSSSSGVCLTGAAVSSPENTQSDSSEEESGLKISLLGRVIYVD